MDYLEGLFLGKLWSDTDFENRRHTGLFILYGLFIDLVVLMIYFTGKQIPLISGATTVHTVLLVVLTLATPFAACKYYRFPIWGKILVLIGMIYKNLIVVSMTVDFLLARISIQSGDLMDAGINYLNSTLEKYTEKFYESAGTFSTVAGVVAGGVHVVFVFLLYAALALVVPGLIYLLYRLIQYAYDFVMARLVIRKFLVRRRK